MTYQERRTIEELREHVVALSKSLDGMMRLYEGKWSDEPPELATARKVLSASLSLAAYPEEALREAWHPASEYPPDCESVVGWGRLRGDIKDNSHEVFWSQGEWYSVRDDAEIETIVQWTPMPLPFTTRQPAPGPKEPREVEPCGNCGMIHTVGAPCPPDPEARP